MTDPERRRWISLFAVAAIIVAITSAYVLIKGTPAGAAPTPATLLGTFHDVERTTLARYNALLRQAQGVTDSGVDVGDHTVADALEHELLPRWRDLDATASATPADDASRAWIAALRAYAKVRIHAWEQLAFALRASETAGKRAALDAYHAANGEATERAKALAALLPKE